MRVFGWVLAGAFALTASIGAQAASLGPGYYPMPNGWNGDWRPAPSPSRRWNGGPVSPRWCPNCPPGGWACRSGARCPHLLGLGPQRRRLRLSVLQIGEARPVAGVTHSQRGAAV